MDIDREIDRVLSELPVWTPPGGFAERVAAAAERQHEPDPIRPQGFFWLGAALQGAGIALVAYVGSTFVAAAATSLVLTLASVFTL